MKIQLPRRNLISSVLVLTLLSCIAMSGWADEIFGVGVALRANGPNLDIMKVMPKSPAEASQMLHQGDRILSVAQDGESPVTVTGMPLIKAVQLIRGPKDSVVRLTVLPLGKTESEPIEVSLTRGPISVPEALGERRQSVTKPKNFNSVVIAAVLGGIVAIGIVVLLVKKRRSAG